jgi:hypothetical protein
MVSLSKRQPAPRLLRQIQQVDHPNQTDELPARQSPPTIRPPDTQELVLYNIVADATLSSSPDPQPTPSDAQQSTLMDRAEAGHLQARLDLMPSNVVEAELHRKHREGDDETSRSLLEHLQDPGRGVTRAQAAARILDELADKTEQTAVDTALVWRYVQLHKLWETHANPRLRSEEGFIKTLNQDTIVRFNVIIGTSTQRERYRTITSVINPFWKADWFEKISLDLLPNGVRSPTALSKRMLIAMAANCKLGIPLEDAIKEWTKNRDMRLLAPIPLNRTQLGMPKTSRKSCIITADVEALNQKHVTKPLLGTRTKDLFLPDVKEDRLELLPVVMKTEELDAMQREGNGSKDVRVAPKLVELREEGEEEEKEEEEEEEKDKDQDQDREQEQEQEQQVHEQEQRDQEHEQQVQDQDQEQQDREKEEEGRQGEKDSDNSCIQPMSSLASKKRSRASDSPTTTTVPNKRVHWAEDPSEDQPRLSKDGKWTLTKVRKHLIRRPAQQVVEDDQPPSSPLPSPPLFVLEEGMEAEPSHHPIGKRLYSGLVKIFSSSQGSLVVEETAAADNSTRGDETISRLGQTRIQEVDNSDDSEEEIDADPYDCDNDPTSNRNSKTGKTLKSACKSIDALQKLADDVQLSQEFRQCCEECSTAVAAVRLALFQAMSKSRSVHM